MRITSTKSGTVLPYLREPRDSYETPGELRVALPVYSAFALDVEMKRKLILRHLTSIARGVSPDRDFVDLNCVCFYFF